MDGSARDTSRSIITSEINRTSQFVKDFLRYTRALSNAIALTVRLYGDGYDYEDLIDTIAPEQTRGFGTSGRPRTTSPMAPATTRGACRPSEHARKSHRDLRPVVRCS